MGATVTTAEAASIIGCSRAYAHQLSRDGQPLIRVARGVLDADSVHAYAATYVPAVTVIVREEAWQADGACVGVNAELFFPAKGSPSSRECKAVCATCPVKVECLDYALRTGQKFGIWGGLNPRELRALRASQRKAVA